MMYALLICDDETASPTNEELDADPVHRRWIDDLRTQGGMVIGARLHPTDAATTVRVRHGETLVVDGPFTESKDVVGGIVLLEAADLDDAIRIAAGHPFARFGAMEIRPVSTWTDDLGPAA